MLLRESPPQVRYLLVALDAAWTCGASGVVGVSHPEVGVLACPNKEQLPPFSLVNQDPIRLDVAIPGPFQVTSESVVSMPGFQSDSLSQGVNDGQEFSKVLATLLHAVRISPELSRRPKCKRNTRRR